KLHAKIIVEMPELNPIKRGGKSADDKLKQFISAQVDNFRRAYGHDSVDHPRTCALAGTSNNRDVYRDPTGARRFISIDHGAQPIRVGDNDNGVLAE
ncbi:VapE domain-containing protein, partial [Enterococcus faecium]|uniref:VapE domain-containing protein n=1 Tax=Enterococcus faecium TaxID=1352 RepID=UPI0034E97E43